MLFYIDRQRASGLRADRAGAVDSQTSGERRNRLKQHHRGRGNRPLYGNSVSAEITAVYTELLDTYVTP